MHGATIKKTTDGYFRLHIYLRTNKTLIHNSLYVFDNWGEIFEPQKDVGQLQYEMFAGRAKPIRMTSVRISAVVLCVHTERTNGGPGPTV